jgi:predicted  nucleic acid-binding Zn ribbon protein
LKINTINLNGVAEAVKGKFSVYKLKQPQKLFRNRLWQQPDRHSMNRTDYYKNFPNDLYDDETNKYKWERELKVIDNVFDTEIKTDYDLTTDLKLLKPGVYVAEAICKDRFGEEIKAFTYFTLFNKNINELVTDTEIICDSCGWKWKIDDGGDDLYICHKCNYDNNPNN